MKSTIAIEYYRIRIDGNRFRATAFGKDRWVVGEYDETEYKNKHVAKYYALMMQYDWMKQKKTLKKAQKILNKHPECFL